MTERVIEGKETAKRVDERDETGKKGLKLKTMLLLQPNAVVS